MVCNVSSTSEKNDYGIWIQKIFVKFFRRGMYIVHCTIHYIILVCSSLKVHWQTEDLFFILEGVAQRIIASAQLSSDTIIRYRYMVLNLKNNMADTFIHWKKNQIFLIYKEIQNAAVAKSYGIRLTASLCMGKYLRISSHIIRKPFLIYMTLQLLHSEFLYIWGKFLFPFLPV